MSFPDTKKLWRLIKTQENYCIFILNMHFLFFICSKLFNWLKLLLCIVKLVTLYNKLPLVNIRSLTTGGG